MQSPQGDIDSAALGCVHVPQTTEGHKKKNTHTLRGHLKSVHSDNVLSHNIKERDPDHQENVMGSSFAHAPPLHDVSSVSLCQFLCNLVNIQGNKLYGWNGVVGVDLQYYLISGCCVDKTKSFSGCLFSHQVKNHIITHHLKCSV